jgi:hypothetical protein
MQGAEATARWTPGIARVAVFDCLFGGSVRDGLPVVRSSRLRVAEVSNFGYGA